MGDEAGKKERKFSTSNSFPASTVQGYLIDLTHMIQSTSSNRVCQLILRHIVGSKLRILNDILQANPFIRGISEGLKYEHFQGTLKAYTREVLVASIMWSTFWCEVIPKLVENFDSGNKEALKFYVLDMSYETYCKELDKFNMEIETLLGNTLVGNLKNEAMKYIYTVE
ncbi:unnamed protein product [Hymenolepis diminuta]|uniref:Uncharacterized protein n=1 Tax=Hymenolepis diminuta TaxID=6216 RepID=A0A564Y4P5_HYMDI|nr:unnamed protein product [Hymenolepis diminuta]